MENPNWLNIAGDAPQHCYRYFIVYIEEILIEDITRIYIKEVFIRYRALIKIILDRDLRFILVF
jgi:hypothetical protein